MLKLIALMAMCLDHLNTVLGWRSVELWMIGRMAFPLFALVWGYNLARRPVSQASLNRLWLWAILAQPAYWWALKGQGGTFFDLNILFAFAVAGQWVYGAQSHRARSALLGACVFLGIIHELRFGGNNDATGEFWPISCAMSDTTMGHVGTLDCLGAGPESLSWADLCSGGAVTVADGRVCYSTNHNGSG